MSVYLETIRNTPYWLQFMFAGKMFSYTKPIVATANSTTYMQFKTGSTQIIHLIDRIFQTQSNDITVEFLENPTLTDGTPADPPSNLQRQSVNTSDITVYNNPVGVSGGNIIGKVKLVNGIEWKSKEFEMVLKKNTNYVIKVTNTLGSNVDVAMYLVWYESSN